MSGFKKKERKKNIDLAIRKGRLRWFGHVEQKNDTDWIKRCMMTETEGTRHRRCPKKTWWDCVRGYGQLWAVW